MYRKFKADRLFTGTELLDASAVLVTNGFGKVIEVLNESVEDAEYFPGILCPGLINTHCHLELGHLKGKIPRHTGLVEFVQQVLKLRTASEEEKQRAIANAEEEMYRNGIVAVGDICNTADTVKAKEKSSLHWRNFVEVSGFVDGASRKRLDEALAVKNKFDEAFIVPHASYSVSEKLFTLIAQLEEKFVSIHNQESAEEDKLYLAAAGEFLELYKNLGIDISSLTAKAKSSFKYWTGFFSAAQNMISVHNTLIQSDDIKSAVENEMNIWYCLCPNANLYIENTFPPVELLRKHGCRIVLGTDSLASNDCLNVAGEMRLLQERLPEVPLAEILGWATVNGAEALNFSMLGKFEQGYIPGIVQLETGEKGKLTGTAKRIL